MIDQGAYIAGFVLAYVLVTRFAGLSYLIGAEAVLPQQTLAVHKAVSTMDVGNCRDRGWPSS
jgi:hypothetical protein